jgi:hypothetical protein
VLAYAIRHKSAAAVAYWWGVNPVTVARWRIVLGVGRMDSEGSRRLVLAVCEINAESALGQKLPL